MTDKSRSRKITVKDVAKTSGVSVATVSYVLNGTGSVGAVVRTRVRAVVKELGYRPNRSAQAMRTGKTHTLGLILPDLRNPFFPELAQSVENAAREAGYSVFLIDAQGRGEVELEGVERLVRNGVEGVVWCPVDSNNILLSQLDDVPIVVVDRPLQDYDFVCSDYQNGGGLLADYVLDQGHRSFAMITGPLEFPSAKERRDGFMERIGNRAKIEWELENDFSTHLSENVNQALGKSNTTVIVCGNDLIAIGVMRELQSRGKRVPDDISVVGFDDIPWADIVTPGLTSIHQPVSGLGREAVALLRRRILDHKASIKQLTLEVRLVERNSVKLLR